MSQENKSLHNAPEQASNEIEAPKDYQKPKVKIHEPLEDLTFLVGAGATGVGVIVSG